MEGRTGKAGIIIVGMCTLSLLIGLGIGCGPRFPFEGREETWSLCKGRHGFHRKDFSEHALKRMDDRVKALNLTEYQKEQYAAIRQKVKTELTAGQERRNRLMTSIREEMKKDLPDIHEIAGLVSEHVEILSGAMDKGMGLFLEFYEILDDNQKAKVVGHLRDRLSRIPVQSYSADGSPPEPQAGLAVGSIPLYQQPAQKRGDRNGELL